MILGAECNIWRRWTQIYQANRHISDYLYNNNKNKIAIYGMSELGVTLFKDLDKTDIQIVCCIDKKKRLDNMGIKTIIPSDLAMYHDEIDLIIVTPVQYWKEINKELKKYISSKTCVIGLDELLIRIVLEKY